MIRLDKYLADMGCGTRQDVKKFIRSGQVSVDGIVVKKPETRLDKDTEGLLLITNDGALAHRLLSPKKHVDKCYFARICGKVTEEDVRSFEKGVNIGSQEQPEITMPGKLEIITSDDISKIRLTIQEGKFHQVKRMFQAVGKEVIYLKRLRMGTLILDENLGIGEYRPLTKEELEKL